MSEGINLFSYAGDDESDESSQESRKSDKIANITNNEIVEGIDVVRSDEKDTINIHIKQDGNGVASKREAIIDTINSSSDSATGIDVISDSKPVSLQTDSERDDWVAVLDSASNCYYYWNQKTNVTTWVCPTCLVTADTVQSQQKEDVPVSCNTIISSNKEFVRCIVCGGWGTDLVKSSGMCQHCEIQGKITAFISKETCHTVDVHSKADDILEMQPHLRIYKRRPECNIPLSRQGIQKWEKEGSDPLDLGDGLGGSGKRRTLNRK